MKKAVVKKVPPKKAVVKKPAKKIPAIKKTADAVDNSGKKKTKPPYEPKDKLREQVAAFAMCGTRYADIAKCLGISLNTLKKYYMDELELGSERANMLVAQSLYRQATSGNTIAAIFWLKTRAGWREKTPEDKAAQNEKPMTLAEFYGDTPPTTVSKEDSSDAEPSTT